MKGVWGLEKESGMLGYGMLSGKGMEEERWIRLWGEVW